ncbi:hypothetical protein [Rhabdochlamydiaceae symbiont of Dictyostelium giganteum]
MLAIRVETLEKKGGWISESYITVIHLLKELGRTEEALEVSKKMKES